jgi:hypothetical protein
MCCIVPTRVSVLFIAFKQLVSSFGSVYRDAAPRRDLKDQCVVLVVTVLYLIAKRNAQISRTLKPPKPPPSPNQPCSKPRNAESRPRKVGYSSLNSNSFGACSSDPQGCMGALEGKAQAVIWSDIIIIPSHSHSCQCIVHQILILNVLDAPILRTASGQEVNLVEALCPVVVQWWFQKARQDRPCWQGPPFPSQYEGEPRVEHWKDR